MMKLPATYTDDETGKPQPVTVLRLTDTGRVWIAFSDGRIRLVDPQTIRLVQP